MNNIKNSIGWADFSWNPVTGCRRGCQYCYARRIHERFNKTPFSGIRYHPTRMDDLFWLGGQTPSIIFVGSMSDIEYWPKNITEYIIREISNYPTHTFMFLSKNAWSYDGFIWPQNTMQGLTVTQTGCKDALEIVKMFDCPRPFLSIEPLLGMVYGKFYGGFRDAPFEKIIVGAQTGPKAVVPKPEWIQSVRDNVPADRIYWKRNIKRYL